MRSSTTWRNKQEVVSTTTPEPAVNLTWLDPLPGRYALLRCYVINDYVNDDDDDADDYPREQSRSAWVACSAPSVFLSVCSITQQEGWLPPTKRASAAKIN